MGEIVSCCLFLGNLTDVLGGQNYLHQLELGSSAANHHISTVSLPGYDMRGRNDDMFRGVAAENGRLVRIAMVRGGRRLIVLAITPKFKVDSFRLMHSNS